MALPKSLTTSFTSNCGERNSISNAHVSSMSSPMSESSMTGILAQEKDLLLSPAQADMAGTPVPKADRSARDFLKE